MLHQFTFSNFKSFKFETTLDLIASPITEHINDVATDCYEEKVLKVAALFGANASGKSNVIKAFQHMRNYVLNSFLSNELNGATENTTIAVDTFKFDNSNEPSKFEVLFSFENNIYNYGYILENHKIQEEFLYVRDKDVKKEKYNTIFYRVGNKTEDVIKGLKEATALLKVVGSGTLFLSLAARLKIPIAVKLYDWFSSSMVTDYGQDQPERIILNKKVSPLVELLQNEEQKSSLEVFVKAIDLGIEGFSLIENEILSPTGTEKRYQVITYHKNIEDGNLVPVPLSNESSGTRKMITLFIPISKALKEGSLLFIDELDAKLHPLLIRYLIILFHSKESNPKNAQLIFATHDVFSLDKSNFRRDEIWFVDKDEKGISDLYSLDSFLVEDENGVKKVRKDASYGKDYIAGKYKSVPNLRPFSEE
ncbi:ATP-binding protein [Enterococcus faecalis]|uniref:AAA family ATPase n=1 Tax=Enterococcus faecalis TaxID=1351 RepID=UPI002FDC425A